MTECLSDDVLQKTEQISQSDTRVLYLQQLQPLIPKTLSQWEHRVRIRALWGSILVRQFADFPPQMENCSCFSASVFLVTTPLLAVTSAPANLISARLLLERISVLLRFKIDFPAL
jgi:hypothetical protein